MLTKREAAIITIYTGVLIGEWSDAHRYAQELMGRPVWTHEFADSKMIEELRKRSRLDFVDIPVAKDGRDDGC